MFLLLPVLGCHGSFVCYLMLTLCCPIACMLSAMLTKPTAHCFCGDRAQVVYASGVDCKLVQIRRVQTESSDSWVVSGRARDHSHDVRAVVLTPCGRLVTGGVDTSLIVYPAATFGRSGSPHRKLPPFPHRPLVALARDGLMLYRSAASLQVGRCACFLVVVVVVTIFEFAYTQPRD